MSRLLQQTSNIFTTIVVLVTLATQGVPRARAAWLLAVDWAFMTDSSGGGGPRVSFDEGDTIDRGEEIVGFAVTDPFLPCKNPDASTEDCRTWEGYPRAHLGTDVSTPTGHKLVMFGVRGQVFRVKCSGSLDSKDGGGLVATIEAHGYTFQAMHLNRCQSGRVRVGRVFAETGNSGYSTGPHLHWTQKEDGVAISPHRAYLEATLSGGVMKNEYASIERLKSAIVEQESGQQVSILNPDSGAIGLAQVMPENVPSWTKQCLGRELTADEFRRNARAQNTVIDCKLEQYWKASSSETTDEKVRDVASVWYSGSESNKNSTRLQPYGGNVYPSIQSYTYQVLDRFDALTDEADEETVELPPLPGDAIDEIPLAVPIEPYAEDELEAEVELPEIE
ncbi:MAG: M23 family metallopeptidase [Geitlerinemataceae cyanobacterium]